MQDRIFLLEILSMAAEHFGRFWKKPIKHWHVLKIAAPSRPWNVLVALMNSIRAWKYFFFPKENWSSKDLDNPITLFCAPAIDILLVLIRADRPIDTRLRERQALGRSTKGISRYENKERERETIHFVPWDKTITDPAIEGEESERVKHLVHVYTGSVLSLSLSPRMMTLLTDRAYGWGGAKPYNYEFRKCFCSWHAKN